jgi:hypothetical protein
VRARSDQVVGVAKSHRSVVMRLWESWFALRAVMRLQESSNHAALSARSEVVGVVKPLSFEET